jgi:hypothetical protein
LGERAENIDQLADHPTRLPGRKVLTALDTLPSSARQHIDRLAQEGVAFEPGLKNA